MIRPSALLALWFSTGAALFAGGGASAQDLPTVLGSLRSETPKTAPYRDSRSLLLERLGADLDKEAGLAPVVKFLRALPPGRDDRLPKDVVNALPHEERMVGFLAEVVRDGLRQADADVAMARLVIARLGGSQNPAYLTPLLDYVAAREEKLGDTFDAGYDAVVKNFPRDPKAVEFLWKHVPPESDAARRKAVGDVLAAYDRDDATMRLLEALRSPKPESRGLAIRIAWEKAEPEIRTKLVASLREVAEKDLPHEEHVAPLDRLSQLAGEGIGAFEALVDVVLADGRNRDEAGRVLVRILRGSGRTIDPDRLDRLVKMAERKNPPLVAFEVLELLDVAPVLPRLEKLFPVPEIGLHAAYAAVGRLPDAGVRSLLAGLATSKPEAKTSLLNALRDRYTDQAWGRDLLPVLEDPDEEVARLAAAVLIRSTDGTVRARIEHLDEVTKLRLAPPYFAIRDGLLIDWSVPRAEATLGKPFFASVVLENTGVLPVVWPLGIPEAYGRWQVATAGAAIGPVALEVDESEEEDEEEAEEDDGVLWKGETASYSVDLGSVLATVGPGVHVVRLEFMARGRHAPHRHRPDFVIAGQDVVVLVKEPPKMREWLEGKDGVRAWIESPHVAWREKGWKRFRETWQPAEDAADKDETDELLYKLAKTAQLGKGGSFEVEIENQLEPTETFTVTDRGTFVYARRIEGAPESYETKLTRDEALAFFLQLYQGDPFDHWQAQVLGLARERQVTARLTSGKLQFTSTPMWEWEFRSHPRLAPWFEVLERWKKRALAAK